MTFPALHPPTGHQYQISHRFGYLPYRHAQFHQRIVPLHVVPLQPLSQSRPSFAGVHTPGKWVSQIPFGFHAHTSIGCDSSSLEAVPPAPFPIRLTFSVSYPYNFIAALFLAHHQTYHVHGLLSRRLLLFLQFFLLCSVGGRIIPVLMTPPLGEEPEDEFEHTTLSPLRLFCPFGVDTRSVSISFALPFGAGWSSLSD
jgi:hypothetical protein